MTEPSQHILSAARAGDRMAWGRLYERYRTRVGGVCLRLLRERAEAEDATSEAFERAYRALESYDPERPFEPWLLRIATRLCLNRLRRRSTERRLFIEGPAPQADSERSHSPFVLAQSKQERAALQRVLQGLPESYRIALVLKYFVELSYDEIAEQLGISPNHVAVTVHRAKAAARRAFADQELQR